jgi:hypothetical protein
MTAEPSRVQSLRQFLVSRDVRQVAAMMFLAAVILWNQIENAEPVNKNETVGS